MIRILGIIQDLVNIRRICPFNKNNMRPPFPQMGGNFDQLVFRLLITFGIMIPSLDFLHKESFVTILFTIDRGHQKTITEIKNFRKDPIYMLAPQPAVDVDPVPIDASTGKSCIILPAVSCIDVSDAIPEDGRIRSCDWRSREKSLAGCNMEKLVVGGEKRRRHGGTQAGRIGYLRPAWDLPSLIHTIFDLNLKAATVGRLFFTD